MQRMHSSKAVFLPLAIALVSMTFSDAQAQTNNEKPVQAPERVGVETADALPLSLNEAIRLALENNNDIRTSRIDVEKAEFNLTARRGAYDPQLFSETYFERSSTPIASFLGGNNSASLEQKDFTGKIDLAGRTPKFGGSHTFDWSSTRFSSNNFFNALDPAISSRLDHLHTTAGSRSAH